jgi:hypothetical protein
VVRWFVIGCATTVVLCFVLTHSNRTEYKKKEEGHSQQQRSSQPMFLRNITADALKVMLELEQSTYYRHDYLSDDDEDIGGKPITVTADDRKLVVDWCFKLADQFSFCRETVAIAMNLFDNFLSQYSELVTQALRSKIKVRLIAICALYISIKLNEREGVPISSKTFAELSCGRYTVHDIESTELIVLTTLSWNLNGPTALQIAMHFFALADLTSTFNAGTLFFLYDQVQHQTELAVREYELSIHRSSSIAVAAIFNAIDRLTPDDRNKAFKLLAPVVLQFDLADIITINDARDRLIDMLERNSTFSPRSTSPILRRRASISPSPLGRSA